MLQAHSTALPRIYLSYHRVRAHGYPTKQSSNKTKYLQIVSRKRPDTPCGWQSCKNPWTAERAAYTVMGYCTTSSTAPLTSSCISGPCFFVSRTSMSCHSVCPRINNVARQTRSAPKGRGCVCLAKCGSPHKDLPAGLADYLITIPAREATKPHPRATKRDPEVPSHCISRQW